MNLAHSRHSMRQQVVLGLMAALLLSLSGLGIIATQAAGPIRQVTVSVPESALSPVSTGIRLKRGQRAVTTCSGKIWAGVWFTPDNGPEGWTNTSASSAYPLPGAHEYSVIGKLKDRFFYVGAGKQVKGRGPLSLWINDNTPNNGSGAFQCTVKVYAR